MVKTTAYTIGDNHTPNTVCADGTIPHSGVVAYNGVPFGTRIYIDGDLYIVRDRALHNGTLDIYMESVEECLQYGVQYKEVYIIED